MDKDKIFITNISKMVETVSYYGDSEPSIKMLGIKVSFNYKTIESTITIYTNEPMAEEEIKDKIIEVLQ